MEWRREGVDQTSDALSQATTTFPGIRGFPASRNNQQGSFNFFNPLPLAGAFTVTEGFAEVGVPILGDQLLAKALSGDFAVRQAQYSLQGGATTWKYSFTDQVVDGLSLRFTQSRDILGAGRAGAVQHRDPEQQQRRLHARHRADASDQPGQSEADARGRENHHRRRLAFTGDDPGLQLSLDYFNIDIADAITALTPQQTIQECQLGNQTACQSIVQNGACPLIIFTKSINVSAIQEAGYDLEASYATPLYSGRLSTRLLLNHLTDYNTRLPGVAPIQVLNTAPAPAWKGALSVNYALGRWDLSLQQRYISSPSR